MKKILLFFTSVVLALVIGVFAGSTLTRSTYANSPPKVTKDVVQVSCKGVTLADIVPVGSKLISTTQEKPSLAETGHAESVLPTQFKGEPNFVKRE